MKEFKKVAYTKDTLNEITMATAAVPDFKQRLSTLIAVFNHVENLPGPVTNEIKEAKKDLAPAANGGTKEEVKNSKDAKGKKAMAAA